MANILKVSVLLEAIAKTQGFQAINQEARRTEMAMKKLQPTLKVAGMAFNVINGGATRVAAAVGAAGGLLVKFGGDAMRLAAQTKDLADASNLTTTEMQVLGYAARTNGAAMEDMAKATQTMQKAAVEAARGNDELAKKFARLGISATEFARLSPAQQIERFGRAVASAGDQQEALAAAMDIVGTKNAPKLMAALKELGVSGYDELAKKAEAAGQVMSVAMITQLDQAQQRLELFKNRVTIIGGEVVGVFLEIEKGFSGLPAANKALQEAETKFGLNSLAAAKARLEVAKEEIKLGKTQFAELSLNAIPSFTQIRGRGNGRFNADVTAVNAERARVAQMLAAERERQAKAASSAAEKMRADEAEARRAAADEAAKAESKGIKDGITEWAKAEAKKTKLTTDFIAAREKAEDEENKKRVEAAKRTQAAFDAIFNRPSNDYQRRGLQLGAAGGFALGNIPGDPTKPITTPTIQAPATILMPNNAGREDVKITVPLLRSIDMGIKALNRKETSLA